MRSSKFTPALAAWSLGAFLGLAIFAVPSVVSQSIQQPAHVLGAFTTNDCVKVNASGFVVSSLASCTPTNAPVAFASIPACTTSVFFQPLNNSYYDPVYCDGASTLHYYWHGFEVTLPVVAASWTVTNGASGTAAITNSAGAVVLSTTAAVAGMELATVAVPGTPYTRTLHLSSFVTNGTSTNDTCFFIVGWTAGTAITNGSHIFRVYSSAFNASSPVIQSVTYTNFTFAGTANSVFGLQPLGVNHDFYVQLTDDGTTNRTIKIASELAGPWSTWTTLGRTVGITATRYGFGAGCSTITGTFPWTVTLLSNN